jgi:hypothetical protein
VPSNHNKIREYEKRTGKSMNVKGVSKMYYDYDTEDTIFNYSAALDLINQKNIYIYHELLVEEDILSNGTNWFKYGYTKKDDKIYKYYYEIKKWGNETKELDSDYNKSKVWKAAMLMTKHIGSNFDDFAKENNIELKRDINWAIKMLAHGVIVYREEFPEVILFPIGSKNNPETKLNVDDLFAEDWTIFRGKSLKEVLDDLDAGKSIRRKSWYPEYLMGKYSKNFELNLQDLKARDWEVIDIEAEVNQIQKQHLEDRNEY